MDKDWTKEMAEAGDEYDEKEAARDLKYQHDPEKLKRIKSEMEELRKQYEPLEDMLKELHEAEEDDEKRMIGEKIVGKFGGDFEHQYEVFFGGPKDYDDESMKEWAKECYFAQMVFMSSDLMAQYPKLRLAERSNHSRAGMSSLFMRAIGFERYLGSDGKYDREDDDTYWDYMKSDYDAGQKQYQADTADPASYYNKGKDAAAAISRQIEMRYSDSSESGKAFRDSILKYKKDLKSASSFFGNLFHTNSKAYKDMLKNLDDILTTLKDPKVMSEVGFNSQNEKLQKNLDALKANATTYFGEKLTSEKNANRLKRFGIAEQIMSISNKTLKEETRDVDKKEKEPNLKHTEEYDIKLDLDSNLKKMKQHKCGDDPINWFKENLYKGRFYLRTNAKADSADLLLRESGAALVCDIIRRGENADKKLNDQTQTLTKADELRLRRDRIMLDKLEEYFAANKDKNLQDACIELARNYRSTREMGLDIMKTKTEKEREVKANVKENEGAVSAK